MFSISDMMNVFGPHQQTRQPRFPCFDDTTRGQHGCGPFMYGPNGFGSFPGHERPERTGYRNPEIEHMTRLCPPMATLFHLIGDRHCDQDQSEGQECCGGKRERTEKDDKTEKKCKRDPPKTNCNQTSGRKEGPYQCTMHDVMKHAESALRGVHETRKSTWRQTVDCRGFDSRNIKVKIDGRQLLLKAFKKQESEDGVRTSSMRKAVSLPENIDNKKITCKLAANGFLIIEAPYINKTNPGDSKSDDVIKEILSMVLPGLEQLVGTVKHVANEHGKKTDIEKEECVKSGSDSNDVKEEMDGNMEGCRTNKVDDQITSEKETSNCVNETNGNDKKCPSESGQQTLSENDMPTQREEKRRFEVSNEGDTKSSEVGSVGVTTEPIITFPVDSNNNQPSEGCDGVVESGSSEYNDYDNDNNDYNDDHNDDDVESNVSDESFVLLSQLEKENAANNDTNTDTDTMNTEEGDVTTAKNGHEDNPLNTPAQEKESARDEIADKITSHAATEDNHRVIFRLEMPSYNPDSMKVTFDNSNRLLLISASKEQMTKSGRGKIPPSAKIIKSVAVTPDVDVTGLQCYFRDGSLTVTAPSKLARDSDVRDIPINA